MVMASPWHQLHNLKPVSDQSHRLEGYRETKHLVTGCTFYFAAKYFGVMEIRT